MTKRRRQGSRTKFIFDAIIALTLFVITVSTLALREPPSNIPPIIIPEPSEFTPFVDG